MASFGGYLTPHAVFLMNSNWSLGLFAALGAFTIWGVGVNIASVSYLSLLSELSEEHVIWRSRTISTMWTAMILSTIATSITLSILLDPYTEPALYTAFGAVWLVATMLILFGAAGIEPPPSTAHKIVPRTGNPLHTFHLLANNATARRFFFYLVLVLVSIHAQDVLLEPFGAEVLGMAVAQTSRLTSIWGIGVFLTLVGGLPLVRRWGKKTAANIGALVAALAFAVIIATGLLDNSAFFMGAVLLLGLGGGLMTVSNLSFMLDMTVPQAAGLYIGAWGVANFAGQALGSILSGLLRDLLLLFTGSTLVGYLTVFGMEVVGLLIAVWLFRTISVEEFRRNVDLQLHDVLAVVTDS